eukprot:4976143-Pyramimonas_sp.AAC.2
MPLHELDTIGHSLHTPGTPCRYSDIEGNDMLRDSPARLSSSGIQTGPDARFYSIYSEMAEAFSNEGKALVLQVRFLSDLSVSTRRQFSSRSRFFNANFPVNTRGAIPALHKLYAKNAHSIRVHICSFANLALLIAALFPVLREARAEDRLRWWLHQACPRLLRRPDA